MEKFPANNSNPLLNVDCQTLLDENRALKDENLALQDEVQNLRARFEEPEELQRAISEGDVDALGMPVSKKDLSVIMLDNADSTFLTLADIANEDIVVVDAEFKISYIGKRLLDKTGYIREEVIGRPWLHFVDVSSKVVAKDGLEQVCQGSKDSYEIKLIRKDGSPYWVIISAKLLFNNAGEFKGILGMLTDITEHKQTEISLQEAYENIRIQSEELQAQSEELRIQSEELQARSEELQLQNDELRDAYQAVYNSETKYRSIVETTNEGIWVSDAEARTTYVNKKMAEMLGYSPEELIGRLGVDFADEEKKTYFKQRIEKRGQGIDEVHENKFVRKDGSSIWALVNSKSLFDTDGKFAGVLAMLTDITERKQAEESLQKAHDSLEEKVKERTVELEKAYNTLEKSEEKYRNIVETANEGIWIVDPESRTTYINERMSEMLGYLKEEMIGRSGRDFTDEEGTAISKLNMEKRKQGVNETHEFKLIRKDGSPLWTIINAKSLFDKDGQFIGSMSMLTDITERKKAEEILKLKLEELKRSNEELEQFAYVSSHDLQEPLRMISSYLQLLERRYKGNIDETADKYIHFAVDGAFRMQNLINDLLEFSRVTTKAREPELTDSEFVLNQTLSDLEIYIKENKATVSHDSLP